MIAATVGAVATGVANAALGRVTPSHVELGAGDPAPAETARAYGVLSKSGFAARWTFYIGLEGRILGIDTHVDAASHGRDVAARLSELGIS